MRFFAIFFFFHKSNPFESLINSLKWFHQKIRFREDIRKKRDSAQCDTAPSQTLRSITLRRVWKLKCPKIQNCLTLSGVGLRAV